MIKKRLLPLLFCLLCTLIFGLSACGGVTGQPTALQAPTLSLNGSTASWNSVENATKYEISVSGALSYLENTVTQKTLNEGESLKVRAVGDSLKYSTSEWSQTVTYTSSTQGTALSVPVISISSAGVAFWTAIPNASGYKYKINGGTEQQTSQLTVQLTAGQSIAVKACGNGSSYLDSAYSSASTYTVISTVEPTYLGIYASSTQPNANANHPDFRTLSFSRVLSLSSTASDVINTYYSQAANLADYHTFADKTKGAELNLEMATNKVTLTNLEVIKPDKSVIYTLSTQELSTLNSTGLLTVCDGILNDATLTVKSYYSNDKTETETVTTPELTVSEVFGKGRGLGGNDEHYSLVNQSIFGFKMGYVDSTAKIESLTMILYKDYYDDLERTVIHECTSDKVYSKGHILDLDYNLFGDTYIHSDDVEQYYIIYDNWADDYYNWDNAYNRYTAVLNLTCDLNDGSGLKEYAVVADQPTFSGPYVNIDNQSVYSLSVENNDTLIINYTPYSYPKNIYLAADGYVQRYFDYYHSNPSEKYEVPKQKLGELNTSLTTAYTEYNGGNATVLVYSVPKYSSSCPYNYTVAYSINDGAWQNYEYEYTKQFLAIANLGDVVKVKALGDNLITTDSDVYTFTFKLEKPTFTITSTSVKITPAANGYLYYEYNGDYYGNVNTTYAANVYSVPEGAIIKAWTRARANGVIDSDVLTIEMPIIPIENGLSVSYTLVTSTAQLTEGAQVIIAHNATRKGVVAGGDNISLSAVQAIFSEDRSTLTSIAPTTNVFTVSIVDGGFTFATAGEQYLTSGFSILYTTADTIIVNITNENDVLSTSISTSTKILSYNSRYSSFEFATKAVTGGELQLYLVTNS